MKTELRVRAVHQGGMRVYTSDGQFHVSMDYPQQEEDVAIGPTPLTMLLASLAACSLNSVVLILKKMQQPLEGLGVEVCGVRRTEHPTSIANISLEFKVKGEVDPAAVAHALKVSEERLCPVWNMLKASTAIKAGFHMHHEMEPETAQAR